MSTFLDRAIGWISPARGLSRLEARARIAAVERVRMVYDGATTGRRSHGWRVAASDANSEVRLAAMRLRNVSRDMVRNNPFPSRAIQVIDQNVVGAGIVPSVKSRSKARAERIRDLIRAHLDTTDCDVTGRHDLYGLQALVMRTIVESGEALVRRRYSTDRKLALPFQMHVLEPDYLNALVDGPLPGGGFAVQGIEFDARGRRVAYHLYDEHPGSVRMSYAATSTRVPARDVAHIFRVDRPGQERGVTWFAPVILRMRDLADFIDAQLMRQKVAACFAGFVTSERDPSASLFAPDADAEMGHPIETVAPGMFEYLRPGERIEFGAPPQVGDFDPYTRATQREIAVGLGVTYEALSGDLSQVNYSSGRMGWIEFQRSIDAWRWRMFIPQFCARVADWTLEAAGVMAPGGATGGPEYSTDVVMVASGFEQRNQNWSASRARYDISTGIRTREQMAEVIAFFRARKGRAFGFRFRDWGDFEATDQQCQAVSATVFQLVKRYPSGPVVEIRTITRPVVGSVVVRVNGTIVTPTIDHATGRLTFGAAPAATPIATFRFDVPVRFDTDHLQVISRAYNLQNVQSIPLVEIRA